MYIKLLREHKDWNAGRWLDVGQGGDVSEAEAAALLKPASGMAPIAVRGEESPFFIKLRNSLAGPRLEKSFDAGEVVRVPDYISYATAMQLLAVCPLTGYPYAEKVTPP